MNKENKPGPQEEASALHPILRPGQRSGAEN